MITICDAPASDTRLTWPVTEWPLDDQQSWRCACDGRGIWGDENPAVAWSPAWRRLIESGYGRFLCWLSRNELLAPAARAIRIQPEEVSGFFKALAEEGLAGASIANIARALRAFGGATYPEHDWQWLAHRAFRLKARAVPRRDKRLRIVHSLQLYQLGLALMKDAPSLKSEEKSAIQYRDGLMISLLAARPLRLKNFTSLSLGRSLVMRDRQYLLLIDAEETKAGRGIIQPIPSSLHSMLDEYLRRHRKTLLRHRADGEPTRALWIAPSGKDAADIQIRKSINDRTKASFGRSINPHLFRDCLATTMATDDPAAILSAVAILGHSSFKTIEQHYNHARLQTAAKDFSLEMIKLRNEMLQLFGQHEVLAYLATAERHDWGNA
jgi:integrase/recombinase XerD